MARGKAGMDTVNPKPEIPCLSLKDVDSEHFVSALNGALSDVGFVALADHGLPHGLRNLAFEQAAYYFSLPLEQKMACHVPGGAGARGYTPFGVEVAKDQSVPDLKEFYHVGRHSIELLHKSALPSREQLQALGRLPQNVWPQDAPLFRDCLLQLYACLEGIGVRVLAAIARGLDLEPHFFENKVDVGNSILRLLHYPPLSLALRAEGSPAVRAAAHEDINLITLLVGSEQPGLEVLSKAGQWIPAPSGDDLIICNVGDMLQRLTNHRLCSTTHRVVNPPSPWADVSRYSMPFFLHLNSDFVIQTLPSCISAQRPNRYPEPIAADDFLRERLLEIGLL